MKQFINSKVSFGVLIFFIFFSFSILSATSDPPDKAVKLDSIGLMQLQQGKFLESIKTFKSALEINSEQINSIWGWAASNVLMDNIKEGKKLLEEKLINLKNPEDRVRLEVGLSGLLFMEGDKDKANTLLLNVVDNLDDFRPLFQVGVLQTTGIIWREAGEIDNAIMANEIRFEKASELDFVDSVRVLLKANALWDLAHFAMIQNDFDLAHEYEKKYLNLDFENPRETVPFKKMQGMFAIYDGRYDEAIAFFKTRNTAADQKRLALAYERKGDKEMANQVRSKLVENYNRGIAYLMIRDNIMKEFEQIL